MGPFRAKKYEHGWRIEGPFDALGSGVYMSRRVEADRLAEKLNLAYRAGQEAPSVSTGRHRLLIAPGGNGAHPAFEADVDEPAEWDAALGAALKRAGPGNYIIQHERREIVWVDGLRINA